MCRATERCQGDGQVDQIAILGPHKGQIPRSYFVKSTVLRFLNSLQVAMMIH